MDFNRFCENRGITIKSVMVADNPHMSGGMPRGSSHYKVTLYRRVDGARRQLTTFYSQGPAWCSDPKAGDVLACLLSDARAGQDSFEDFCWEFGLDCHSNDAKKTHRQCVKTAEKIDRFLGDDLEKF